MNPDYVEYEIVRWSDIAEATSDFRWDMCELALNNGDDAELAWHDYIEKAEDAVRAEMASQLDDWRNLADAEKPKFMARFEQEISSPREGRLLAAAADADNEELWP